MAKLVCPDHNRRVQVLKIPIDEWTNKIKVIHRNDGSRCITQTVRFDGTEYPITHDKFTKPPLYNV